MIYIRVLTVVFILLFAIYYASVIMQVLGLTKVTDKEIKFIKAIIPFYYWL